MKRAISLIAVGLMLVPCVFLLSACKNKYGIPTGSYWYCFTDGTRDQMHHDYGWDIKGKKAYQIISGSRQESRYYVIENGDKGELYFIYDKDGTVDKRLVTYDKSTKILSLVIVEYHSPSYKPPDEPTEPQTYYCKKFKRRKL
jgi:hypothetical protein